MQADLNINRISFGVCTAARLRVDERRTYFPECMPEAVRRAPYTVHTFINESRRHCVALKPLAL